MQLNFSDEYRRCRDEMLESLKDRPLSPLLAHHEVGHAVAALLMGARVESVDIDRTASCYISGTKNYIEAAILDLAGPAAERMWRGEMVLPFGAYHSTIARVRCGNALNEDTHNAFRSILCAMPGADDDLLIAAFRYVQERAFRLLRRPSHWQAVERVATALLERGHLSGEEVSELMRGI